jgi:hypothetical protein
MARAALHAAEALPGVAGGDPGPLRLCITSDPELGRLSGVAVTAQPDGRYAVELCLVARLVPLHPLAGDVRAAVAATAARRGLSDRLGTVDVTFASVEEAVT